MTAPGMTNRLELRDRRTGRCGGRRDGHVQNARPAASTTGQHRTHRLSNRSPVALRGEPRTGRRAPRRRPSTSSRRQLLQAQRVLRALVRPRPRRPGRRRAGRSRPRRRVRRDRRLGAGVLRPVQEDLAARLALVMVAVTSLGCAFCSSSATVLRQGRGVVGGQPLRQVGVQVQALAAAGAPAGSPRSRSASRSRTSSATWQHSCSPAGSPGSRSMTSRSALRGRPLRPTVHWWTCSSSAARLTSQVSVARSSTIGKTRWSRRWTAPGSRCVGHLRRAHPRRRAGGGVLLEEARRPGRRAASGSGSRHRSLQQREQHRRDLGVVVEHLALGECRCAGRAPCGGC